MLLEKRTTRSFLISLVIHGIILIVLGLYLLGVTEDIKDVVEVAFFEPKIPKLRQVKPPNKPNASPKQLTFDKTPTFSRSRYLQSIPKSRPTGTSKSLFNPAYVTEFTPQKRIQGTESMSVLTSIPSVNTSANLPAESATLPEAASIRGNSPKGTGLKDGIQSDRNCAVCEERGRGSLVEGINPNELKINTRLGLSMMEATSAGNLETALKELVEEVSLESEKQLIPPLAKGEPGGRVIGKGKKIIGVFRFVRLKHHFSDWWDDPTSIAGIANWLNEHTQINTDL